MKMYFYLYLLNVWNPSWQTQDGGHFEICDAMLNFCDVVIDMYYIKVNIFLNALHPTKVLLLLSEYPLRYIGHHLPLSSSPPSPPPMQAHKQKQNKKKEKF